MTAITASKMMPPPIPAAAVMNDVPALKPIRKYAQNGSNAGGTSASINVSYSPFGQTVSHTLRGFVHFGQAEGQTVLFELGWRTATQISQAPGQARFVRA